jgi:DNA-binding LacI/PurR family transcriptional regulator
VGALAVKTLVDILQNDLDLPQRLILPTELVIRDSCGAGQIDRGN